ncbi:MAG: ribosome small subunit-dependent GTPase A [Solirubrobacterales bacterium]
MDKINLYDLGLNEEYKIEAAKYGTELSIGRVSVQFGDLYQVITEEGEMLAEVSGKLAYSAKGTRWYPSVGDWVLVDRKNNNNGNLIIHHILSRKSSFERKTSGVRTDAQVVAANIDTIFVCMSLNNNFNVRRLERYISVAWDSNAVPVIILTKADLCSDITDKLMEVEAAAPGVDIVVTSCISEEGCINLYKYIKKGKTAAFIGSSGVGKSSLINMLKGRNILKTSSLSSDDKGKHTTTKRQLILLENGGVVIDTPGMRELGILNADLDKSFSDIEELAMKCKFSDCQHENEPNCAVKKAVESGMLDIGRLENYKKLQRELKYNGLNSRELEREKINQMFGGFGAMKEAKKFVKNKKR